MENSTKPHIDINDRVYYEDKRSTRTGTVIETNYDEPMVAAGTAYKRARIVWDDKRPRTWIRISALKKIVA